MPVNQCLSHIKDQTSSCPSLENENMLNKTLKIYQTFYKFDDAFL